MHLISVNTMHHSNLSANTSTILQSECAQSHSTMLLDNRTLSTVDLNSSYSRGR